MQMKVTNSKGNHIATMEQWKPLVRRNQWKVGRSAYSLADFIINQNGAAILASRISSVLSQKVTFEQATPEFGAAFDLYSGPARLDLGTFGQVGSREGLFVGIEAKVDEPFGSTVCKTYQYAIRKRQRGERTNAPERVEGLLSRYFADTDEPCASRFADVGYQLLTATAGTVATMSDLSVFYVTVFKTHEYDEEKGKENQLNYERFISLVGGECLMQDDGGCVAHELTLDGRRLICIYEYFNIES